MAARYARLKQNPDAQTVQELRTVTNHFTAPADACPTFQKTCADLAALTGELRN